MLVDADDPFPIDGPVGRAGRHRGDDRARPGPGTLVTPVARRRPWKLARETVTLDHLSGGRAVLGVGLGEPGDAEFGAFGEPTDDRLRAERLEGPRGALRPLVGRALLVQG